jgi:mRNA-degrading endonuclease YafQ of YafQ-DinJ toxin-antitoxin module
MAYRLRASKRFKKARAKKTLAQRTDVDEALRKLRDDPRQNSLHTHKVQGSPGVWESRIDGGNRLTWNYDGEVIVLRMTCHHDILTRNP